MSDVVLSIGGRNYTVACADGDEERVRGLSEVIGDRLAGIGAKLTTPMEAKNLLIAGLILADELDEAKKAAQGELAAAPPTSEPPSDEMAEGLEAIADRLEKTAILLEGGDTNA